MKITGRSPVAGIKRCRVLRVTGAAEPDATSGPGVLNWQAGGFENSIKADLRAVVKERVVHRHVCRVRNTLIDEGVSTVATFGVPPVPGRRLLILRAVVLRPTNHHELIGGMDGNTFKLEGVERRTV